MLGWLVVGCVEAVQWVDGQSGHVHPLLLLLPRKPIDTSRSVIRIKSPRIVSSLLLIGHQLPINPSPSYSASSSSSPHPFVIFHHDHAIVRHDFNMITNPQSDYKVEFPWTLSLYSLILCHDSHDPHSFLSCPMPHFLLCYPFLYMVLLFSHAFISIGKKTVRVLAQLIMANLVYKQISLHFRVPSVFLLLTWNLLPVSALCAVYGQVQWSVNTSGHYSLLLYSSHKFESSTPYLGLPSLTCVNHRFSGRMSETSFSDPIFAFFLSFSNSHDHLISVT